MPFEVYSAHVFNNSFGRVYDLSAQGCLIEARMIQNVFCSLSQHEHDGLSFVIKTDFLIFSLQCDGLLDCCITMINKQQAHMLQETKVTSVQAIWKRQRGSHPYPYYTHAALTFLGQLFWFMWSKNGISIADIQTKVVVLVTFVPYSICAMACLSFLLHHI